MSREHKTIHACGCVTIFGPPLYELEWPAKCLAHLREIAPYRSQIKVGYVEGEHESTAYVGEEPDHNGFHYGTNKHTDEPVRVVWVEERSRWEAK